MNTYQTRRQFMMHSLLFTFANLIPKTGLTENTKLIRIGLDAEVRDTTSTSDEAIRAGIEFAIEDINQNGGVLDGYQLELVIRDNRVVPSRGAENLVEFAHTPNLVAMFCGKFSPVALEQLKYAHQYQVPLLDPWAAADGIIDNGYSPNYVFRLALRDSWAMTTILRYAHSSKLDRVGLLLPNNGWGRSCRNAVEKYIYTHGKQELAGLEWYNWGGDKALIEYYANLRKNKMNALLLVANEPEGAALVQAIAKLPLEERVPILSHWGITGGNFPKLCGPALQQVDLKVIQTFSFDKPRNAQAKALAERSMQRFHVDHPNKIPSLVGLAHAYDLTHLLVLAIKRCGSLERAKIQTALEELPAYEGVIKRYAPAFNVSQHEALSEHELFMARYTADGCLIKIG